MHSLLHSTKHPLSHPSRSSLTRPLTVRVTRLTAKCLALALLLFALSQQLRTPLPVISSHRPAFFDSHMTAVPARNAALATRGQVCRIGRVGWARVRDCCPLVCSSSSSFTPPRSLERQTLHTSSRAYNTATRPSLSSPDFCSRARQYGLYRGAKNYATMAETANRSRPNGVQRLASELEKPLLDNRTYRVIKLPNQLEALIIHDADTDKASAAMDVNVGSFSDDAEMPGMAHAVEHLLFMGTEKVRRRALDDTSSLVGVAQRSWAGCWARTRLTRAHVVSRRERLQLLSDQVRRLCKRLHRAHLDELLLRAVRILHLKQPSRLHECQHREPAHTKRKCAAVRRSRSLLAVLHQSAFPRRHTRSRAACGGFREQEEPSKRCLAQPTVGAEPCQ